MSAILFDLDGTLIDSLVGIHATASAVLADRGHPTPDRSALQALVGAPLESIFATLVPALDAAASLTYANHYREMYWSVGVPHTPLFPGISDLLTELASLGAGLAVVTTKRVDVATHILAALDIARHFRIVIGGDSTPHHKPHPAPALAAVTALSADPQTATV
ncbi:MAG TPA: HAD family hydrolase, partial [Chloroflexota bacterium]|nr:HAD family hydrolase [Chloroflexota bacterium]